MVNESVFGALEGAAVGILLGVLIGLSASPVVGTVIGALTAVGFAIAGSRAPNGATAGNSWRLTMVCIAAVPAMFVGTYMRTHDALAPTLNQRLSAWTSAGFRREDAEAAVLREIAGLVRTGWTSAEATAVHSGVLYGAAASDEPHMELLKPTKYANSAAAIAAWQSEGRVWSRFASTVAKSGLSETQQMMFMQMMWDSVDAELRARAGEHRDTER